jgi:hypothetical protein
LKQLNIPFLTFVEIKTGIEKGIPQRDCFFNGGNNCINGTYGLITAIIDTMLGPGITSAKGAIVTAASSYFQKEKRLLIQVFKGCPEPAQIPVRFPIPQ